MTWTAVCLAKARFSYLTRVCQMGCVIQSKSWTWTCSSWHTESKEFWMCQPSALVEIPLVPTSCRSYPSSILHGSKHRGCSRCCPGPLCRWPARGPSWPCSLSGRALQLISCVVLCLALPPSVYLHRVPYTLTSSWESCLKNYFQMFPI